jgi:hypothetical protein
VQQAIDEIKTALRVLTAIVEKRYPDPADIDELRRLAPLLAEAPPDELACGVIRQALNYQEKARAATA